MPTFDKMDPAPLPPPVPKNAPASSSFVLWRDLIFIFVGSICLQICVNVEASAGKASESSSLFNYFLPGYPKSTSAIIDSGFVITTPLYVYLRDNRDINDLLAALNSFFLFVAMLYALKVS